MKKALAVILVLGLLFTACAVPAAAVNTGQPSPAGVDPTDVPGDADGDGERTILDATRIQRFIADLIDESGLNLSVCDFDNDNDVTILDATAIQRDLAGLPVNGRSDYCPAKHPHLYVASAEPAEATLYTSRDQLDPALDGHQTLLDDYDDAFFAHSAILAVHTWLPSGSDIPQFDRLVIEDDKLTIVMLEYAPSIGTDDVRPVFFCLEVKKSFYEGTDGIRLIYQPAGTEISVNNNNVDIDKAHPIPANYQEEGYTKVDFEEGYQSGGLIPEEYPGCGFSLKLNEARGDSDDDPRGIAGIISNPYDMEQMIRDSRIKNGADPKWWGAFNYEIDKAYDYDLRFFQEHALVAITQRCSYSPSVLNVRGLYKKDGALYIDASIESGHDPAACDVLTLVKVRRADLEGITAVTVGKYTDEYKSCNGFLYKRDPVEDTVEIGGYIGSDTEITVPNQIEWTSVTAIADNAFRDHTALIKVTVPGTVTHIGDAAFKDCTGLKTANLPYSGLKSLGKSVFEGCASLETTNLSYNIAEIPDRTFFGCQKLQSITVPACVRQIGAYAFCGCAALSEVIPTLDADKIGVSAFYNCPKLKKVILRTENAEIGKKAFGYTDNGTVDGFTVYGYTASTAKVYAVANGLAFKSIDNEGPIQSRRTEDDRKLPVACGQYSEEAQAIYATSLQELEAALDTLYDGRRDQDKYAYAPETYDEAWFNSHDILAIRVCLQNLDDYLYVSYVGRDYDDNLVVEVNRIYNDFSDDGQANWHIVLVSLDKLGFCPRIDLQEYYQYEVAPLKPIIYLYPEEETALSVTVGKPEDLTCTYPAYNDGWHVTAKPDGTLIDDSGRSYYALYWEGKTTTYSKADDGFVVKGEDTAKFFEEKLAQLGLNEREAQEFIVYWLPQMQKNKYNFIRFATAEEINDIMPLRFSVQPDTLIRVLMQYKPLDAPIEVTPQILSAPARTGFTAVEWGGCLIK